MELTDLQKDIIKKYIELVKEYSTLPGYTLFHNAGVTQKQIRHHFGNLTNLHALISMNFIDEIAEYVVTENQVFNKVKLQELQDSVTTYKRFFITTYVNNKQVHPGFLDSIRSYCEINDAKLLLIPCDDVASTKAQTDQWVFPPSLANDVFVFEDVKLNDNIFVSSIKISAKQIKPTTGLNRIGQRNGSYVFASPKQFLEYVVNSPDNDKLPHALMTTGAITIADYSTDKYMSERTSYIAESDHIVGGLIVEIEDDKTFHFRHVQAEPNGSFVDLGTQYNIDGTTEKVSAHLVLGDYHVGQTDPVVRELLVDICNTIDIKSIYLHDFFDGYSISHHDLGFPLKMAKKYKDNRQSLYEEIIEGRKEINWLLSIFDGNLVFVKGNHDEVLVRYLTKGSYVMDPQNHFMSLRLAMVVLSGGDPLQYAYELYDDVNNLNDNAINEYSRLVWLQRDEEWKIGGVELGAHGDLGLNGSRASLQGLERAYGNCVVGHSHSAAILRGVFRVGTSTKLKLDYNRGPSSWSQTHCLVYEKTGARQLINIIRGKWKL
jgi:hypothetical protein